MFRRSVVLAAAALAAAGPAVDPARAQGPDTGTTVTPPGSRISVAPLPGMVEANDFTGFADPATGSSVAFTEMPPEAWSQLRDGLTAQSLAQRGIREMRRSMLRTNAGEALLIEGVQTAGGASLGKFLLLFPGPGFTGLVTVTLTPPGAERHPLAAVRTMLASTTATSQAAISPRDALAFAFDETPRMKLLQTLGRGSAILTETPAPPAPAQGSAAVIAASRVAEIPADRSAFATRLLNSVEQATDIVLVASEPRAIGPHAAVEQRATGKDRRSGVPVALYHLVIVEGDRVLRLVAFSEPARAEAWLPEFRALADSLRLR